MKKLERRQQVPIVAAVLLLLAMFILTDWQGVGWARPLPALLFLLLMISALTLGISAGSGGASLLPMVSGASFLVLGMLPTLWLLFVTTVIHGLIRYMFGRRLQSPQVYSRRELLSRTAANSVIISSSLLAGGAAYQFSGGRAPLGETALNLLPYLIFLAIYLLANHFLVGVYLWFSDVTQFQSYRRSLSRSFLFEMLPFLFAPTLVAVYRELGEIQFALLALGVLLVAMTTFNISVTRQRLERRVQELSSLQQISRLLSASLDLDTVINVIHRETAKVMPVSTFFVALLDGEAERIQFPRVLREGESMVWEQREFGNGLTEYVLRQKKSLLIPNDVIGFLRDNHMDLIGEPTSCWLGVPILAGNEVLGVLSVQSITQPNLYDENDQALLEAIASQAAMALKNARLYGQTNAALRRRVRELVSIMRTTTDGLLLIGGDGRVRAVNHAFAALLGLEETAVDGQFVDPAFLLPTLDPLPAERDPAGILAQLGYTPDQIAADCAQIRAGALQRRHKAKIPTRERHIASTLTPVLNQQEMVTDWLLVVRDVTEEHKLALLREDMTHMLVHDLRAPLGVLLGSLQTSREWLMMEEWDGLPEILELAQQGGERMLRMIDQILQIYKFETGQIPLDIQQVSAEMLLLEARDQLGLWAAEAGITIDIAVAADLPLLAADPDHVGRALQNLLDNAIKFSPDGSRIELQASADGTGRMVLFGVRDFGPGIPLQKQDQLFQKFSRLGGNGRRPGSGLGLAYCKLVAAAHGGDINVQSSGRAGEGSTFILQIPAAQETPLHVTADIIG